MGEKWLVLLGEMFVDGSCATRRRKCDRGWGRHARPRQTRRHAFQLHFNIAIYSFLRTNCIETMATSRKPGQPSVVSDNPIPSSSPAFGTPVHPINPHRIAPIRAPPALKPAAKATTVLPILLPPGTLRPLAFRTFTKKHNLTLTSSALQALAAFIGRHCGSGWREEGLAEKVLEEVAKSWKKSSSHVIVEGDGDMLKNILKTLEGSMSGGRITQGANLSRQGSFNFSFDGKAQSPGVVGARPAIESQESFGMSSLEVEDKEEEEDLLKDPREWIKVIGAFDQPKLVYNLSQKHFDR